MPSSDENDILSSIDHRPWPMPETRWVMTQRWNDLLFAHWPVPAAQIGRLLPEGLAVDTFDGSAWVGIVPFWMDRVQIRGLPLIPGANRFPELNLRTTSFPSTPPIRPPSRSPGSSSTCPTTGPR
jgi:uncharacterized protein YqjF (DUF2071 family)